MSGRTRPILGRMLVVVLLPSMLKRMICPKTHTPPMMLSTSCKTSRSATSAKVVPVTMTRSSGWNSEPGLKPIGTSS